MQRKNSGRTKALVAFRENRNASATKSGPGRYAKSGEPGTRITKQRKKTRAYVALMAAWAQKRVTKATLRDDHGAYTVVGRDCETNSGRRMWVGGISAQRGY